MVTKVRYGRRLPLRSGDLVQARNECIRTPASSSCSPTDSDCTMEEANFRRYVGSEQYAEECLHELHPNMTISTKDMEESSTCKGASDGMQKQTWDDIDRPASPEARQDGGIPVHVRDDEPKWVRFPSLCLPRLDSDFGIKKDSSKEEKAYKILRMHGDARLESFRDAVIRDDVLRKRLSLERNSFLHEVVCEVQLGG